jgi:hypothetical protein
MFSLTIGTKQLKVSNVDHRNSVENVTAEIGMVVDLLGMVVKLTSSMHQDVASMAGRPHIFRRRVLLGALVTALIAGTVLLR